MSHPTSKFGGAFNYMPFQKGNTLGKINKGRKINSWVGFKKGNQYGKHNIGKKHNQEFQKKRKIKMNEWYSQHDSGYNNIGFKKNNEYFNNENSIKNRFKKEHKPIITQERNNKISIKMTGNKNGWINGSSFEPYTFEFNNSLKEQIRKLDNYICQLCDKTQEKELSNYQRKLSIHHIDYDKKNCEIINLITLCNNCNIKVNTNREYWTNFFQKKVSLLRNNF